VFEPLLEPARYRAAHGGRGSGKSHFFGELLVETCQAERGTLAVCIREAQRTLAQSSKRLIESKIASLGIGSGFKLFSDKIETPGEHHYLPLTFAVSKERRASTAYFQAVITVATGFGKARYGGASR
jgi:phage terminase large subunit